jgi:hypothetical protein
MKSNENKFGRKKAHELQESLAGKKKIATERANQPLV